ncbi:Eco57I restriction-modification methylase domain-containing protein [uncultured Dialister sp.]|uniref:Eco57I restriction-modification methylase domain-containing protein n=1 Tax=Dialister succinatiphilus TaxID=487173 RepID=UPI00266F8891|nr:Eco57I restriction-modification methylase domain-containing protein [uncultured Dialister sp.]
MIINISDDMIELNRAGLLKKLLEDKTTKGQILWGTDAYRERGPAFEREREMDTSLLLYENAGLLKTRARKAFEQQSERTRQHGEVFTPRWICDVMIDHLDKEWFGVKEIDFLSSMDVLFVKKKWKKYVDSKRLEITCGEGPFLVQRYDVSTGNIIPVPERKGILDRKLQVVSRYAETEEEWEIWARRAYEATYGYEFQGDNLLISRVNFMMTYREFYQKRWQKEPELSEWEKIENIITWNLWQMDGLTGEIPYARMDPLGPDLFQLADPAFKEEDIHPACRIYDWRNEKKSVVFNEIGKRNRGMKFDYIIGNPPYQEESGHSSEVNGQRARKNIFQKFQMVADSVTKISNSLIYPGGALDSSVW